MPAVTLPSSVLSADKPRGYAFVEFEHKNDMKTAYKMADGKKLENRRVIVDVERGRTVPGWQVPACPQGIESYCWAYVHARHS